MVSGFNCAVCEGRLGPTRTDVVDSILDRLRRAGQFSVAGVAAFWGDFRDHLCFQCQNRLDSIAQQRSEALRLLEQAVQLDSSNEAARKNLGALKQGG